MILTWVISISILCLGAGLVIIRIGVTSHSAGLAHLHQYPLPVCRGLVIIRIGVTSHRAGLAQDTAGSSSHSEATTETVI